MRALKVVPVLCVLVSTSISAADKAVEEIVITAQKRSQALQDVPLAVAAYDDRFLKEQRVENVGDLIKYTPGFSGYVLGANNPVIPVRGLNGNDFGIGGDSTLGIYVDDVFAGRKTASIQDLIDVQRVEMVRGPQSTLFGRSSTAGAISVTTHRPDPEAFAGSVTASVAEYDRRNIEGVINVPLADGMAMRVAGRYRARDGYAENDLGSKTFDEDETYGGRIAFEISSIENVTILLQADGHDREGTIQPYRSTTIFAPGQSTSSFHDPAYDLTDSRNQDDRKAWNASAHVAWEIAPSLTLTSITGVRDYDVDFGSDDDGSFLPGLATFQFEDGRQVTQELRLNGETGPVDWFVGASYIDDHVNANFAAEYDILMLVGLPPGLNVTEIGTSETNNAGWAVYGDGTLALTDRLSLTAGLRYSSDDKDFDLNIPLNPIPAGFIGENVFLTPSTNDTTVSQSTEDTSWLPRVIVDYRWTDALMTYVSASKGFRSGGFNTFSNDVAYEPEEVWSYEAGFKATLLDGRATFDADVFYYEYDDLQVLIPVSGAFLVRNAASAEGKGLEAQLTFKPVDGIDLYGGLTLLDTEYQDFLSGTADYGGNTLTRAPETSYNLGGRWTFPFFAGLSAFVAANTAYYSREYLHPSNDSARRLDSQTLVDMELGITGSDERWTATLFASNLMDDEYFLSRGGLGFPFYPIETAGPPRVIGVELSAQF